MELFFFLVVIFLRKFEWYGIREVCDCEINVYIYMCDRIIDIDLI